jgi:hypothetical protein
MQKLKLYLVSQDYNRGYDTYDSFVGAFESAEEAQNTHPYGESLDDRNSLFGNGVWVTKIFIGKVKVQYLGEADESVEHGIICSSYNAG